MGLLARTKEPQNLGLPAEAVDRAVAAVSGAVHGGVLCIGRGAQLLLRPFGAQV